jgi:hypothetical protein
MSNDSSINRSINVNGGSQVGVISGGDNAQIKLDALHFNHLAGDNPSGKERLTQLVTELNRLLEQVPEEKKADAEAVATLTEDLVSKADVPAPNKPLVRITAEGMKEAAGALAGVVPAAVTIVNDITELIAGMLK